MKMNLKQTITIVILLWSVTHISPQDKNIQKKNIEIKESPITQEALLEEKKKEEEKKKREEEQKSIQKYYAKLKNPPGFYEGAFLVSFMGGTTLAPSGSYISHEKVYDQTIQNKILTDQVNQDLNPSYKGYYFQPNHTPGIARQFDFEYGWKDKIGMGFTIMQNSLEAVRQDVIPGVASYYKEYVDLVPRKRTIYRGNSMSFLATFHPLPKTFFDPYVAFRAGIVGFTGEAHSGIYPDRFAYSNKVNNGIGGIVGLAGGLNIYFGRYSGLKTEVAYYNEYLKSDEFSTRTLNSYQAMIGFFLNFSNIQSRLEE